MVPRKGTRPVVPLADADFNLLFARIHRLLRELLVGRGLARVAGQLDELASRASEDGEGEFDDYEPHGVSFVDDLATAATFLDPAAAREEAGEVFECAFIAAAHFGLKLQLGKTKAFGPLLRARAPGG